MSARRATVGKALDEAPEEGASWPSLAAARAGAGGRVGVLLAVLGRPGGVDGAVVVLALSLGVADAVVALDHGGARARVSAGRRALLSGCLAAAARAAGVAQPERPRRGEVGGRRRLMGARAAGPRGRVHAYVARKSQARTNMIHHDHVIIDRYI